MSRLDDAFVAATRFGLGPGPGELDLIRAAGPRRWLRSQLDAPDAAARSLAALPDTAERMRSLGALAGPEDAQKKALRMAARQAFAEEQRAHLMAAARSTQPFRERLVAFWANHFTVSTTKGAVVGVVSAFERDVVRANLDRRFEDMLRESTRHPAMLVYLDNQRSIGPRSRAGRRTGRGLNENLAREVLELHTLGVDGGYDQRDVEGLATLLTGWTLNRDRGGYRFVPHRHEPGTKRLLGRTYPEGEDGGQAALADLAAHPATARHVATKLARHFVADEPPTSAVDRLARAFTRSGGHLPTVHRALVDLDAPFRQPLAKVRSPWDLVVATARALGYTDAGDAMLAALRFLGQMPYQAPSPQGWPDVADAWLGPADVLARLDWAAEVARTVRPVDDVPGLAAQVLGPALTPATSAALRTASGADALALLLASPAFQRR